MSETDIDRDTGSDAFVDVDGVRIHYVRRGSGPTMVLVHGFPQDHSEWTLIMDRLASTFTLLAVDLRGVGLSDAPPEGYDAMRMAEDVFGVVDRLGLSPAHLVGHDVGGWVAYAYGRRHPEEVRSVTVAETPIPGTRAFSDVSALDVDVPMWHAEFHMVPDLPETLVADRQAPYFRYFFDTGTRGDGVITDADVERYATAYRGHARLHAAFEMYRALPEVAKFIEGQRDPIDVPLTLIGGEHVFGSVLVDTAGELRSEFGWSRVDAHVIDDGMHYLMEERPDEVADILETLVRH